jgi:hypothetical protein
MAHVIAVTLTAHVVEMLDIAGIIRSEPLKEVDGTISAQALGLGVVYDAVAVARFTA